MLKSQNSVTFFSGEKTILFFVLERVSVKSIQLRRSENMELENINKKAIEAASILVVGDAMLDRYWFGDASRISPEAPVPVVKVTRREDRLGGAANVARNSASLGSLTSLLAVIGDDEAGNVLMELLEKATSVRVSIKIPTLQPR